MRPKYFSLVKRLFFSLQQVVSTISKYFNTVELKIYLLKKKNYTWNSLELSAGKEIILNALVTIR